MTAANEAHAALAVRERDYGGLTMAFSPAEAVRRLQELQAFVHEAMKEGEDYGTIPGTQKPTLYQPGAQKLAEIYGFAAHFEPVEVQKDWERGFFYFEYCCVLSSRRSGDRVGEGMGSANSNESKYRWRWVEESMVPEGFDKSKLMKQHRAKWVFRSEIPEGIDPAKLPKQEKTSKTGKPYTVWNVGGVAYRIPNPDVADVVNTLQKMACKRAYVMAVISVTRSSGIFTQDLEDLPREAFGEVEEKRSWEKTVEQPAPAADAATPPATSTSSSAPKAETGSTRKGAAPPVEPRMPTEAETMLFIQCRDSLEVCDSQAAVQRVAKTIGEYVRGKKIAPVHVPELHAVAKAVQKRLRETAAKEPADQEPPADVPTTGSDDADDPSNP